jgi:hypothetical protein
MGEADTDTKLRLEIKKWTVKIAKELKGTEAAGEKGHEFLTNIKAYVSDSGHFLSEGDMVRSFEAIIWAWSWLEIGKDLGLLRKRAATS